MLHQSPELELGHGLLVWTVHDVFTSTLLEDAGDTFWWLAS